MIDYVGDLSRNDAALLRDLGSESTCALEFGAGASTQILAHYCGKVDCVETDARWIDKTAARLAALGIADRVAFHPFGQMPIKAYDIIFVDGADELRRRFALMAWECLALDGLMIFHDTRRTTTHGMSGTTDMQNALAVIALNAFEISRVEFNWQDSNCTVIWKREPLPYVDWNIAEGRSLAQIGLA